MKRMRIAVDAIFAGVMIAVASSVYLNCQNKFVGAFLFSIGLITIMFFGFELYTGKVGYLRSPKKIPYILSVFLFNAVGCALIMTLPTSGAEAVWRAHADTPMGYAFAKAVVCGILIYVCVAMHKKHGGAVSILTTLVAIPAFILGGAEHSIADICYMLAARDLSWRSLLFVLIVAAGNAVGSLAFSLWVEFREKM